jgi:hypothetical protein
VAHVVVSVAVYVVGWVVEQVVEGAVEWAEQRMGGIGMSIATDIASVAVVGRVEIDVVAEEVEVVAK